MTLKFVPHPRYGDKPRYTGFDPDPNSIGVVLHWNTNLLSFAPKKEQERLCERFGLAPADLFGYTGSAIKGTAIAANVTKQTRATVQVTHYYDIQKVCRECSRPFIFFAEEQKYWYEELGFPLDADCIRCVPCRKRDQHLQEVKRRYDELLDVDSPTMAQEIELAECRLALVEEGVFHSRQLERVRNFLNRHRDHPDLEVIRQRVKALQDTASRSHSKV